MLLDGAEKLTACLLDQEKCQAGFNNCLLVFPWSNSTGTVPFASWKFLGLLITPLQRSWTRVPLVVHEVQKRVMREEVVLPLRLLAFFDTKASQTQWALCSSLPYFENSRGPGKRAHVHFSVEPAPLTSELYSELLSSCLAQHLTKLLSPFPRRRRLSLVHDMQRPGRSRVVEQTAFSMVNMHRQRKVKKETNCLSFAKQLQDMTCIAFWQSDFLHKNNQTHSNQTQDINTTPNSKAKQYNMQRWTQMHQRDKTLIQYEHDEQKTSKRNNKMQTIPLLFPLFQSSILTYSSFLMIAAFLNPSPAMLNIFAIETETMEIWRNMETAYIYNI